MLRLLIGKVYKQSLQTFFSFSPNKNQLGENILFKIEVFKNISISRFCSANQNISADKYSLLARHVVLITGKSSIGLNQ